MKKGKITPVSKSRPLVNGPLQCFFLFLSFLMVLPFAGCKTTGSELSGQNFSRTRQLQQEKKVEGGGLVSVFLTLREPKGVEVSFDLTSVELLTKGKEHPLLSGSLEINSKNIGSGQMFVARNGVPADSYTTLRFSLRNASIEKEALPQKDSVVEMELPSNLLTQAGDSHSLFITWDVSASLDENGNFAPEMNVSLQAIPFITDLIYVACPEIDTVYVIRTDKNWVISSLGVEGGPTYIDVDLESERLFILTPEKLAIQVVDLVTNKIVDNIFLPLSNQPNFMTVRADKRYAYILDEQGSILLSVDLLSGAIVDRIVLRYQPHFALFLEEQNKLAISSLDTNAVYLIDPENFTNNETLLVANSPEGLLARDNILFIAESGSNSVTAYDLSSFKQTGSVNAGFSPRRLLARDFRLYVANFSSNSISYMLTGQLNISGEIFLRGTPLELASSESRLWIYAGDQNKGGLHVIDATSNRLRSFIDLKALPVGLLVIE